jgi:hypothetical protein
MSTFRVLSVALDVTKLRATKVGEWIVPSDLDSETCVFALSCLELTKSFRPTVLVGALPRLPPLAQHFAARCMLTMDHADGFRWLLDVAESGDARAVTMSRQLLAWLTGETPNSDREEFEARAQTPGAWNESRGRVQRALGVDPGALLASPPPLEPQLQDTGTMLHVRDSRSNHISASPRRNRSMT